MRILIAEDDFTSRSILSALLKKAGHEPVETFNGVEAWAALQKPDAPRLVILDWIMPEMDGLEVVRRVRALPGDLQPYILILTSKTEKREIITGLDAGANDYLSKPFDAGELRARIEVGRRMVEMQEELFKSREALAHQANHDPLTGMLNRRAILDRLHKELARAGRHSDILSLGICDIDHFKAINDTYGHQTGDDVLCGLARILTACCREYDSFGRVGGEEFLIIAPMKAGGDNNSLYERIRLSVSGAKMGTRSGPIRVTVSIGVTFAENGETVDGLVGAADAALYRAKEEGRNRVVFANQTG